MIKHEIIVLGMCQGQRIIQFFLFHSSCPLHLWIGNGYCGFYQFLTLHGEQWLNVWYVYACMRAQTECKQWSAFANPKKTPPTHCICGRAMQWTKKYERTNTTHVLDKFVFMLNSTSCIKHYIWNVWICIHLVETARHRALRPGS